MMTYHCSISQVCCTGIGPGDQKPSWWSRTYMITHHCSTSQVCCTGIGPGGQKPSWWSRTCMITRRCSISQVCCTGIGPGGQNSSLDGCHFAAYPGSICFILPNNTSTNRWYYKTRQFVLYTPLLTTHIQMSYSKTQKSLNSKI